MGRPKRLYPLGKYRLRTPKEVDKDGKNGKTAPLKTVESDPLKTV